MAGKTREKTTERRKGDPDLFLPFLLSTSKSNCIRLPDALPEDHYLVPVLVLSTDIIICGYNIVTIAINLINND
jgi:hypothetical protein